MKTDDTILGKKLRPALRLIKDLDRREFNQLIAGMQLLFDGIQEFKTSSTDYNYNPYAISKAVIDKILPDDIDEADEALTQEMKKTKKSKKK